MPCAFFFIWGGAAGLLTVILLTCLNCRVDYFWHLVIKSSSMSSRDAIADYLAPYKLGTALFILFHYFCFKYRLVKMGAESTVRAAHSCLANLNSD